MEVIVEATSVGACQFAARVIAKQVQQKPKTVLGLATGRTMLGLYRELVLLSNQGLDFSQVTTFNLDEYVGLPPAHEGSCHFFMRTKLFDLVGLPPEQTHLLDGLAEHIPEHCAEYEREISKCGGIDLQVLGIGENGHIAFNEPTSSLASRTRFKTLAPFTIDSNQECFPMGEKVPAHVLTMGIGTILEARTCVLLAFGRRKAQAVANMVEGPLSSMVPASALQLHNDTMVLLDEEASLMLTLGEYYRSVHRSKPDWQRRD
jgi:glucosamine-6-phosphate deaminase